MVIAWSSPVPRRHEVRVLAVAANSAAGLTSTVTDHFGRCPFYVVVVTEGTELRAARVVANPHVADHAPGSMLPFLRNLGADVILVGKVGPGATHRLRRFEIAEVTGLAGRIGDAVGEYLRRTSLGRSAESPVRAA